MRSREHSPKLQRAAGRDKSSESPSRDGLEQRRTRSYYGGEVERLRKLGRNTIPDVLHGHGVESHFARDRRHYDAIDAARDYEVEEGEIGGDVEREAVPRHPVARMNPNRGDLFPASPDAGIGGVALAGDPEIGQCVDQRLLDLSQIPVQILPVPLEVDDRITDQLSGSVKRHVAAALDLEKLDTFAFEKFGGRDQVLFFGSTPERYDGRMLEQQQHILRNGARDSVTGNIAL